MLGKVVLLLVLADPLKADLMSDDVDKAVAAAQKLGAAKRADLLLEAISMGAPPKVDAAILEALAQCKTERALDTFLRYADNRNPEVRKKALTGLSEAPDKRASARLMEAVGDGDPSVRALAAKFVAKRREKGADEALLKLLRHNDGGAAQPLGSIATPEMTRRLAEMVGVLSDALLAQTLGVILKRSDVADPLRVEIVNTLVKIPGADSTTALVEYVAAVPAKEDRPSKGAAQKAIEQKGGGAASEPKGGGAK
ncbi:MAG TPA: HEAT repeat domain-containing protein [Polyangia bacterium]|nr:HEAT repeat domain-containing protein [Polyangia bacterium]